MPSAKYDYTITDAQGESKLATHTELRQQHGFTERQVIRATQGKIGKSPKGLTLTARVKAGNNGLGEIPQIRYATVEVLGDATEQDALEIARGREHSPNTAGIAVAI